MAKTWSFVPSHAVAAGGEARAAEGLRFLPRVALADTVHKTPVRTDPEEVDPAGAQDTAETPSGSVVMRGTISVAVARREARLGAVRSATCRRTASGRLGGVGQSAPDPVRAAAVGDELASGVPALGLERALVGEIHREQRVEVMHGGVLQDRRGRWSMAGGGRGGALAALARPVPVDRREVDSDQSGDGGEEHEQGFHGDLRLGPSNHLERFEWLLL